MTTPSQQKVFAVPEGSSRLIERARKEFASRRLSRAEEEFFGAVQTGEKASALTKDEKQDDLASAATWSTDRVLDAACIAWLVTDREASSLVTHRGIRIVGMRIDGDLDLRHANIKFPLCVSNSVFTGNILLQDAQIPLLSLKNCYIKELLADRINHAGELFLCAGFSAEGEVRLLGAMIGGNLDCSGARLSKPDGKALVADLVKIGGSVFLNEGFRAEGEVRFLGATIGGSLDCDGALLSNPKGKALSADRVKVGGSVFLRNDFRAEGEVRLVLATMGGSLDCDGGQVSNTAGPALSANAAKITGSAFLRNGFRADGELRLQGVAIGGSLEIHDVVESEKIRLNLRYTKVATFWDDEKSWPKAGNLSLDGYCYERLSEESPLDAKRRINWLRRQSREKFLPQPYEKLAAVLREMGHERDARIVMIAKNRERARFTRFPRQGWWWYNFFGRLIGYGYAPWRAFAMSLAMIMLGAFLFGAGFSHDLISPTKESAYEKNSRKLTDDYPVFTPLVYSVESFIPLLKLDQSANWMPNANRGAQVSLWRWQVRTGSLLRSYLWFHIIVGWVLTTLWVGAVTGLVKS